MKQKAGILRAISILHVFFHFGLMSGQNEMFHAFTIKDGLPQNTANALMQDSKGQLWIGTQAGVAIFDGARFKTIGTEGDDGFSLSNNMVESLYEDANGRVYIGTRNGMNIYDPGDQKIINLLPDTSSAYGNNFSRPGFYEDSTYVWFISSYSLFAIDKTSAEIKKTASFAPSQLTAMIAGKDGLLIASDSALIFYNPQKNTSGKVAILPQSITTLAYIDDRLWIGTRGGIYDLTGAPILGNLQSEAILHINKSSDGRIWIGATNGIVLYDGKNTRFIKANPDNRLEGNLQLSFLEDNHKRLWFGTNSALHMLIPLSEKIEKNFDNRIFNLPSAEVNSIAYSDRFDIIAIGTENGVNLTKLEPTPGKISVVTAQNFLKNQPVNFTNQDITGRIWVGTKSGDVYCFNEDFSHIQLKGNIKGIRGFYYDTLSHQIYIAGSEGLYAAGENKVIYRPEWTSDIKYTISILNKDQGFWVSHSDLIYDVDLSSRKISTVFKKKNEIPSYMISHQLMADSCLWFSSISGGVFSHSPSENIWAKYNLLKGKNIWSTFSDSQGRLWSNSDDGLYIHNGLQIFQKLDIEDGLNYNDFKMTAQSQLKYGVLVYGNAKGLCIINPDEIKNTAWGATPYISGIEVNFKNQPVPKSGDLLLLEPDEKSITLYIGLDDFVLSGGAEISYKLESLNSSWSSFTPINYPVSFTGLSSGEYYLLVKVRDKSGRISDKVLSQKIKILPHFYETVFFKLILFFVVVILMVFIANFSARQKQRAAENKLKTERAINAERERISRDLHDSIGARLTKIISDLDIMELQAELNQQAVSAGELSKTRDYTQDTINNLRETIWTLDSGVVRLQDIFHQSQKYIERYLPEEIEFEIKMDEALFLRQINPEVAVNIFRIIQEMTQNMLKYSKATKFMVNFTLEKNVRLTVWDNGIGFDFQTVSKGKGLKNIIKRLDEIQGTMAYEQNGGSKFIIHFN